MAAENAESNLDGVEGMHPAIFSYHVALIEEAGLVLAGVVDDERDQPFAANVMRLTNTGHDLLDSIRSESVWSKVKTVIAEKGGSWTISLLAELAKSALRDAFFPK